MADKSTILVVKARPSSYNEVFMIEEPQPALRVQTRISCVEFAVGRGSKMTAPIVEPLKGSYGNSTHLSRLCLSEPGVP